MNKKKLAITVGVFDCFHEGHARLLRRIFEEYADEVAVIVHDDLSTYQNKGRFTVQLLEQRLENLKTALILLCKEDATKKRTFKIYKTGATDPSMPIGMITANQNKNEVCFVRGDDWADFPGRRTVEELGIEINLIPYTKGVSTTLIREQIQK